MNKEDDDSSAAIIVDHNDELRVPEALNEEEAGASPRVDGTTAKEAPARKDPPASQSLRDKSASSPSEDDNDVVDKSTSTEIWIATTEAETRKKNPPSSPDDDVTTPAAAAAAPSTTDSEAQREERKESTPHDPTMLARAAAAAIVAAAPRGASSDRTTLAMAAVAAIVAASRTPAQKDDDDAAADTTNQTTKQAMEEAAAAVVAAAPPAAASRNDDTPARKDPPVPTVQTDAAQAFPMWIQTDQSINSSWRHQYEALGKFRRENLHVDVPDDGSDLSKWVKKQHLEYTCFLEKLEGRVANRRTTMNETKLRMLREVGFVFQRQELETRGKRGSGWDNKADLLRTFRNRYGHTDVPQRLVGEDRVEFKGLGTWVKNTMIGMQHPAMDDNVNKKRFSTEITPSRRQRLLDIGIGELKRPQPVQKGRKRKASAVEEGSDTQPDEDAEPTVVEETSPKKRKAEQDKKKRAAAKQKRADESWEAKFDLLKKFHLEHGHVNGPFIDDWKPLQIWNHKQRNDYKKLQAGEASALTANMMQRLTDVGFSFQSANKKLTFEEQVGRWLKFRGENNGQDPHRHSKDGLGRWVSMMRENYRNLNDGKKTTLKQEQADRLTELGFKWSVIKYPSNRSAVKSWQERFEELVVFREQHGHTVVPQKYPGLGMWVHKLRVNYKRHLLGKDNDMTAEKIEKLHAVGFTWDASEKFKGNF